MSGFLTVNFQLDGVSQKHASQLAIPGEPGGTFGLTTDLLVSQVRRRISGKPDGTFGVVSCLTAGG